MRNCDPEYRGAVYLRAESAFRRPAFSYRTKPGEILLLDVTATAGEWCWSRYRCSGKSVRSVTVRPSDAAGRLRGSSSDADSGKRGPQRKLRYPALLPVLLTRYAAQSLYAPLRTVEPVRRYNLANDLTKNTDSTLPV